MAATSASLAERGSLVFENELHGQRFTGYGVGMPIVGLPAYALTRVAETAGLTTGLPITFFPLTNALLFGLIGVLSALLLRGEDRWFWVAVPMVLGPFLPASLTFYSEPLAAAGLLAVAAGLWNTRDRPQSVLPWIGLAVGGALFAVLARLAVLPLVALVIVWGWRAGASREAVAAAASAALAGVLVAGSVNWGLRGSPFSTGYEGQDFTTPLLTGLHGLLVSPERGLLLFFPAVLFTLVCWRKLDRDVRQVTLLGAALLLFSLVFHGRFWTWHGGWTAGPRFLLPPLALMIPGVAALLQNRLSLRPEVRAALYAALGWSGLMALVYTWYSPITWWRGAWPLHGIENQWLFLPQMSLWQAWLEGVPLEPAWPPFPGPFRIALVCLSLSMVAVGLYPLLLPLRGYLGTERPPDGPPAPSVSDKPFLLTGAALGAIAIVLFLSGPRGWQETDSGARRSHLLLVDEGGTWQGWFDQRFNASEAYPLELAVKADALYRILVDEQVVAEQLEPRGPHIRRVPLALDRGRHLFRVEIIGHPQGGDPDFALYWTWPGGGQYLAPAGGEYVTPRPLTGIEEVATVIWRRIFLIIAGLLALLLLLAGYKRGESGSPGG